MRTVGVLRADREEHRPRGRARNGVHEPLAHALDLGDDAVVAQRAVGLRVVGAPDDGEARMPAWGERWLRYALGQAPTSAEAAYCTSLLVLNWATGRGD